jgi:hypothetical protein
MTYLQEQDDYRQNKTNNPVPSVIHVLEKLHRLIHFIEHIQKTRILLFFLILFPLDSFLRLLKPCKLTKHEISQNGPILESDLRQLPIVFILQQQLSQHHQQQSHRIPPNFHFLLPFIFDILLIFLIASRQNFHQIRRQEVEGDEDHFHKNGLQIRPNELPSHDFDGILVVYVLDVENLGVLEVVTEVGNEPERVQGIEGEVGESLEIDAG